MSEIDDSQKEPVVTPEEIMLGAFDAFKEIKLLLQRLINWGAIGGSPSPEITQGVLQSLVELEVLQWERDEKGTILFSKVEKPKSEIN